MVEHYVLDESEGTHGLKQLAIKFTTYGDYDKKLDDFKEEYCRAVGILKENFTYDLIPFNIIAEYAAIDTAVTLELHNKFRPLIAANPKLEGVYTKLLIPGVQFLLDMEEVGIPMSKERLRAAEQYLDQEILAAKGKIYEFEEVKKFTFKKYKSLRCKRKLLYDFRELERLLSPSHP
jgi:DNA polymerase I-like protein with 3'-5' exonuclease and polymerase domains